MGERKKKKRRKETKTKTKTRRDVILAECLVLNLNLAIRKF